MPGRLKLAVRMREWASVIENPDPDYRVQATEIGP
jgi:hypothetical protein